MGNLTELSFLRIPLDRAPNLVSNLLQGFQVLEWRHSETDEAGSDLASDQLCGMLGSYANYCITIIPTGVSVGGFHIEASQVRVIGYDQAIDVEVIFDDRSLELDGGRTSVEALQRGAAALASSVGVFEYACGYEPVMDLATRFFSNDALGPLMRSRRYGE